MQTPTISPVGAAMEILLTDCGTPANLAIWNGATPGTLQWENGNTVYLWHRMENTIQAYTLDSWFLANINQHTWEFIGTL